MLNLAIGLTTLAALTLVVFVGLAWYSRRLVDNAGLVNGKLRECPTSPNCVCSLATDDRHRTSALAWVGEPAQGIARLKLIIEAMPRSRILTIDDHYLHAELLSPTLGFADDIEFLADPVGKKIDVRACARVGYSDRGANRRYAERIAKAFSAAN